MNKTMHDIILNNIRNVVHEVDEFSFLVSVNEVTTMDNQQWINDYVYVMKD